MKLKPHRSLPDPKVTATFRAWAKRNEKYIRDDFYADSDGVWLHLQDGYCDDHGAHTVRGDTATEAMKLFRERVRYEPTPGVIGGFVFK
jgi:hypothetical protein